MKFKNTKIILVTALSVLMVTPAFALNENINNNLQVINAENENIISGEVNIEDLLYANEKDLNLFSASTSWSSSYSKYGDLLDSTQKQIYNFLRDNFQSATKNTFTLNFSSNIRYSDVESGFKQATLAFFLDYPERFWADNFGYEIKKNGVYAKSIDITLKSYYYTNYSNENTKMNRAIDKARTVVSQMNNKGFNTDADKFSYLHDWILEKNTYNYNAASGGEGDRKNYPDSFVSYGALINGDSVCQGYSAGLQMLCKYAGIDCVSIYGKKGSGKHSWNYVKLDGSWYFVDSTNNDGKAYKYNYFLREMPSSYSSTMQIATPNPKRDYYIMYGHTTDEPGITTFDVTETYKAALDKNYLKGIKLIAADVDGDGKITQGDGQLILQYVLDKNNELPIYKKLNSLK